MTQPESDNQPPQAQRRQPGREGKMRPQPEFLPRFPDAGRLRGKVAIVTGGDSGIGRSVAVHMAREGADLALTYLEEAEDAAKTADHVRAEGRRCLTINGDVGNEEFCKQVVDRAVGELGRLDILVNNAGESTRLRGEVRWRFRANNLSARSAPISLAILHGKSGASAPSEWRRDRKHGIGYGLSRQEGPH